MARIERLWSTDFQSYMEEIVRHTNYSGLPIARKRDGSLAWIATAKSKIGQARAQWAKEKAHELGHAIQPGVYARVMREIHPTKRHICQICGSHMSIYYHYPSANFLRAIMQAFGIQFSECDHIADIWDQILDSGFDEDTLRAFIKQKFKLSDITGKSKDDIIAICEHVCRLEGKKQLSPGAMSNFPDRFDGFHTYNRCCRAEQDTGRSPENLKSYAKDRRAYEYWSDGNIHAANTFMGSPFFRGISADHIGPISLGFVHDPRYLRPMACSDNSAKRDRLLVEDIDEILAVEAATGIYPMSWYCAKIWEYIAANYKEHSASVSTLYRDMLKQNVTNYMFVLENIYQKPAGYTFLYKRFIEPKYESFLHTYEFDKLGNIVKLSPRRFTERSNNEISRFARIAFESICDYNEKDNRQCSPNLTDAEQVQLMELCNNITLAHAMVGNDDGCYHQLEQLMTDIQNRIIQTAIIARVHP